MKLKVKMGQNNRVDSIERNKETLSQFETTSSILPNYLLPLVINYKEGETVSKNIEVISCSGQRWASLKSNQRAELLELVEWLGQDCHEYVRRMESMLPKDPPGKEL